MGCVMQTVRNYSNPSYATTQGMIWQATQTYEADLAAYQQALAAQEAAAKAAAAQAAAAKALAAEPACGVSTRLTGGPCHDATPRGGGISWSGWSTFINYAAPLATTIALITAPVPGLDAVTAGVAFVTDTASAITNGINTYRAVRDHQGVSAAWDAGSTILSLVGVGGAAGLLRAAAASRAVANAAADEADAAIGTGLRNAQQAGSLADKMDALRAARAGAAGFVETGAAYDTAAEVAELREATFSDQAYLASLISATYGTAECSAGQCG
jgi:hypothetical protein